MAKRKQSVSRALARSFSGCRRSRGRDPALAKFPEPSPPICAAAAALICRPLLFGSAPASAVVRRRSLVGPDGGPRFAAAPLALVAAEENRRDPRQTRQALEVACVPRGKQGRIRRLTVPGIGLGRTPSADSGLSGAPRCRLAAFALIAGVMFARQRNRPNRQFAPVAEGEIAKFMTGDFVASAGRSRQANSST